MKKELIKKTKMSIWMSHGLIILISAIVLWGVLYYLFSNTTVLKDVVRVLNDGTASAMKITWGVFWIVFPIIVLIQFCGSIISFSCLEEKKKKEKIIKTKRKKK